MGTAAARNNKICATWGDGYVLILVIVISRICFIGPGFGLDPDAWRVAHSARNLLESGTYLPSRAPGYPLHEFLSAALLGIDPTLMVAVSVLSAALIGAVYLRIARSLLLPYPFLGALALTSIPAFFTASLEAMDYLPALLFLLLALLFLLRKQELYAALVLGVAVGFRLTSAQFLIPFGLLVWANSPRKILQFLASTALVATIPYLPILAKNGIEFFRAYYPGWLGLYYGLFELFGVALGLIGSISFLTGCIALILPNFRSSTAQSRNHRSIATISFCAVLLQIGLFLWMPVEPEYLVPCLPFVLIIFAIYLEKGLLLILFSLLVVSPYLTISWNPYYDAAVPKYSRLQELQYRSIIAWIKWAESNDADSVVLAGDYLPLITWLARTDRIGRVDFRWSIPLPAVKHGKYLGREFYVLEGVEHVSRIEHGYDTSALGFKTLKLAANHQ